MFFQFSCCNEWFYHRILPNRPEIQKFLTLLNLVLFSVTDTRLRAARVGGATAVAGKRRTRRSRTDQVHRLHAVWQLLGKR